jgi:hypothetical protein
MAGFTYSTLKTAIQDYLDNNETTFTNNLNNFIQTTEERILKNVQLPVFRKNVTGNLTQDNTYLSTPTDYLSTFSLALIDSSHILEITHHNKPRLANPFTMHNSMTIPL